MRKVTAHPSVSSDDTVHIVHDDSYAQQGLVVVATALCGKEIKVPIKVKIKSVDCQYCRNAYSKESANA